MRSQNRRQTQNVRNIPLQTTKRSVGVVYGMRVYRFRLILNSKPILLYDSDISKSF